MAAFYLDEDAPDALAGLVAAFGHSATTTRAEGRKGVPDDDQLWQAALRGWTLVTLNRRDYELLHSAWLRWGVTRQHAGILVLPHVRRSDLPMLAAAIDGLVSNPVTALSNALYVWSPSFGWRTAKP